MSAQPQLTSTDATVQGACVPAIAPLPRNVPSCLLDAGLTHYEASIAGFAERYRRGETPQTIHVWWARRPHSAMRALLFAALCLDRSPGAFEVMRSLSQKSLPAHGCLELARSMLRRSGRRPRVLDMFGGGGTIPFEGSSLGLEMHSTDSNELSVFLQRSLLIRSRQHREPLAKSVEVVGARVLARLHELTAPLYPARERGVTNYIWSYSVACGECGYRFLLLKRPWLSRKAKRRIGLRLKTEAQSQTAEIACDWTGEAVGSPWTGRNGNVNCPICSRSARVDLKQCRDELLAEVTATRGKTFSQPQPDDVPTVEVLDDLESRLLGDIGAALPSSELPVWSGIVNPALYGMRTHADVFNRRQRIVVLQLLAVLRDEFARCEELHGRDHASAVIGLLSGLVDQMVDWNCRLSMWISQNEQVGRAFCGPGVAMLWDYAETDPTCRGPGNLSKKLDRIVAGARALTALEGPNFVHRAYAQHLPFEDASFDAIVTDPPYYDNVYYNVLADFFYAWKRPLLSLFEPELFAEIATDSSRELVASAFRSGTAKAAHEDYCQQLGCAIAEAARVLKPSGVFALCYSHSSILGWEAVVRAYRSSMLRITSVQPLSIERKQRPRAMTSDAVNTCVVFVARRDDEPRSPMTLEQLAARMQPILTSLDENLRGAGWCSADIGVAAYAHAVAMLANASELSECVTDVAALRHIGEIVKARCPEFQVTSRRSL